jgi:quercetin dioxygenase-like cupin family protein
MAATAEQIRENTAGLEAQVLAFTKPAAVERRSRSALALTGVGVALMIGAAAVGIHASTASHARRDLAVTARAELRHTAPVAAASAPTVGVTSVDYAPGHTSGWHVHPGVHSVVVLSGTLTIYDEHCNRTDYGPGETYLGGNLPHLARNEGDSELLAAVTYVYTSSGDPGSVVAPPSGCDAR